VQTGDKVAIKLEPVKTRHPQLLYESRLYKLLNLGATGGSGMKSYIIFMRESLLLTFVD
jgi:hypothetical protein